MMKKRHHNVDNGGRGISFADFYRQTACRSLCATEKRGRGYTRLVGNNFG